jgi:hypothetical protein
MSSMNVIGFKSNKSAISKTPSPSKSKSPVKVSDHAKIDTIEEVPESKEDPLLTLSGKSSARVEKQLNPFKIKPKGMDIRSKTP